MLPKLFEELTGRPVDDPHVEERWQRNCGCRKCSKQATHTGNEQVEVTCSLEGRDGGDDAPNPGTTSDKPAE